MRLSGVRTPRYKPAGPSDLMMCVKSCFKFRRCPSFFCVWSLTWISSGNASSYCLKLHTFTTECQRSQLEG
jgi:hypothetical protein